MTNNVNISDISTKLIEYINSDFNKERCFDLAESYFNIEQWVSACNFYNMILDEFKQEENSGVTFDQEQKDMRYNCYVLASICYKNLQNRMSGEELTCDYAIALDNTRIEGYIRLCEIYYEKIILRKVAYGIEFETANWFRLLEYSSSGLQSIKKRKINKIIDNHLIDYQNDDLLIAYETIAKYLLEDYTGARTAYFSIKKPNSLPENIKSKLSELYNNYSAPNKLSLYHYTKQLHYKYPFYRFEYITNNFSNNMEDMFILSITNGKENGTYIDFYPSNFELGNNTFLLEGETFKWKGLTILESQDLYKLYNTVGRKNNAIVLNKEELDTELVCKRYINETSNLIDYISISSPKNALSIIKEIPFGSISVSAITIPHYKDDPELESEREIMYKWGFFLCVKNMETLNCEIEEDWWINPETINYDTIKRFETNLNKNTIEDYFFQKHEFYK